jgi:hypothetical protein
MNENILHFWENLAAGSIGVVISMIGFWVAFGKNVITKSDVCEMIETKGPYVKDRQFIMERLSVNKETQAAFSLALQRNTEVMNELKIQIATLGQTLETLERRIENRIN